MRIFSAVNLGVAAFYWPRRFFGLGKERKVESVSFIQEIKLNPVGVVRSQVKEPVLFSHREGLEMQGALEAFWRKVREINQMTSEIIIHPASSGLLNGVEDFSHLLVLYWAHKTTSAGRALKQVHPMGRKDLPIKGVFATCSPARPNPMLLTVVKLLERRGNVLKVIGLDAIDQSPVLDIKPYVKEFYPHDEVLTPAWMQELMEEAKTMTGK